jgi:predicted alpha/beta-fold hydrolase
MDTPLREPDDIPGRVSEERPEPLLALALKCGHIPYLSGTRLSVSHPMIPWREHFCF